MLPTEFSRGASVNEIVLPETCRRQGFGHSIDGNHQLVLISRCDSSTSVSHLKSVVSPSNFTLRVVRSSGQSSKWHCCTTSSIICASKFELIVVNTDDKVVGSSVKTSNRCRLSNLRIISRVTIRDTRRIIDTAPDNLESVSIVDLTSEHPPKSTVIVMSVNGLVDNRLRRDL